MRKIIYTRPDGGLSIIQPSRNTYPKPETLSDDQILARAMKDIPRDAVDVRIVDEGAIPKDRAFRDAWKSVGGAIEHDMEKCREIHRNRLRAMRAPLLQAADVAFVRALEAGAPTADIVAMKQALRDVTAHPAIDAAQTPESLKDAVPAVLRGLSSEAVQAVPVRT